MKTYTLDLSLREDDTKTLKLSQYSYVLNESHLFEGMVMACLDLLKRRRRNERRREKRKK